MTLDVSLQDTLTDIKNAREAQRAAQPGGGSGGGHEPPSDVGLETRVHRLETSVSSIDKTLAVIVEQLKHLATREDVQALRTDVAVIAAKLDTKADATELAIISGKIDTSVAALSGKADTSIAALSGTVDTTLATFSSKIDRMALATDLAELKGRVSRIPTVPVLISIGLLFSILFAAASWVLRHLPPTWTAAFQ